MSKGIAAKSNVPKLFTAEKCAAQMYRSIMYLRQMISYFSIIGRMKFLASAGGIQFRLGELQIGAIETNGRKDQWLSLKQIHGSPCANGVVAEHVLAEKVGA